MNQGENGNKLVEIVVEFDEEGQKKLLLGDSLLRYGLDMFAYQLLRLFATT